MGRMSPASLIGVAAVLAALPVAVALCSSSSCLGWVAAASLFLWIDVFYFIRTGLAIVMGMLAPFPKDQAVTEVEHLEWSMVLPTDLDFMGHMNNARYLRECDLTRLQLWARLGVVQTISRQKGSLVAGATSVRFRRELQPFEIFCMRSKVLTWDEKAFYVEHRMEDRTGFVRCVLLVKQSLIRITPTEVLKQMGHPTQPPVAPKWAALWIESNALSSASLRQEATGKHA
eukprot:m.71257 g.71257  ORF g.71257 m.71257 type:complete len:230 (-) comp14149_c0_seq1:28-717(-)